MASRLTPSFEVRISCFPYHSCSPLDQLSMISLPTSSPGSHPGQHEPTGLARLFASAKLLPNPPENTAGQRPGQPHQRRPSPRAESETTARRSDTRAGSDSTTTSRGSPPEKKQQGNTPQTRPARTSGPPHSSWKQTDTLPGPLETGPSTFL